MPPIHSNCKSLPQALQCALVLVCVKVQVGVAYTGAWKIDFYTPGALLIYKSFDKAIKRIHPYIYIYDIKIVSYININISEVGGRSLNREIVSFRSCVRAVSIA